MFLKLLPDIYLLFYLASGVHVKKVKIFLYFAPINNKEPKMLYRMAVKLIFTLMTFTILIYPIKCVSNP